MATTATPTLPAASATTTPAPPSAPIVVTGSPSPAPRSAFHKKLQRGLDLLGEIADEVGRSGQPAGEVIAFYMCTFNRTGAVNPATNGVEAAWLRTALGASATASIGLAQISQLQPEIFRAQMKARFPANPSPLMLRVNNDDDLLAIHAAAVAIRVAIAQ